MTGFDDPLGERPQRSSLNAATLGPTTQLPDDWRLRLEQGTERFLAEREQRFRQSVAVALESDPDFVAEAQRLGLAIKVDPLQIEQDIEGYRRVAQRLEFNRWINAGRDPILRQQMTDPAFARIAYDDIDSLGALEKLGDAWQRGIASAEFGELVTRKRDVGLSPAETARLDALARYLETAHTPGGFFRDAAEILGPLVTMVGPRALQTGVATGLTAAGATALTGPGAVVAGKAGFLFGTTAEAFRQSYNIIGGQNYADLLKANVSPGVAGWTSRFVGLAGGMLELAGAGIAARGAGLVARPASQAFARTLGRETAKALARPTTGRAIVEAAKGYAESVGGEVTTEFLQEIAQIVGEETGRAIEGLPLQMSTDTGRQELASRLADVIVKTARGMALLALPGAGLRFGIETGRVQRARADVDRFKQWVETANRSKILQRNPNAMEAFAGKVLSETDATTVYVDAARFTEALEQSGLNHEALSRTLPDVAEQLPEALATGGDVVIPTARYTAQVVGTELGVLLQPHIRLDPEGYSAAELPQVQQAQEELAKRTEALLQRNDEFAASARRVEQDVLAQLRTTQRISMEEARTAATIFRNWAAVTAETLGVMPHELAAQFPFRIAGERQALETTLEQPLVHRRASTQTPGARPGFGVIQFAEGFEETRNFGENVWVLESALPEIPEALVNWTADYYRVSHEEAVAELNPRSIVESARAWDDQEFLRDLQEAMESGELPESPGYRLTNGAVVLDSDAVKIQKLEDVTQERLEQPVSTRLPRGLKAVENPSLEALTVDHQVALADKSTLTKNAATIRDLPFLRVEEGATDEQVVEAYVQHIVDNLNWLFDQMPADQRERSAFWYDGGRRFVETWAERYGISEQQAAAVLAVLSPQRDWFVNVTMAERILDIYFGPDVVWTDEMTTRARRRTARIPLPEGVKLKDVQGKKLSELDGRAAAYWVRVFDQAHNSPQFANLTPEGGRAGTSTGTVQWTSYSVIAKALSVLRDGRLENISQQLGTQHKVRSFYNNLFDPNSVLQDVTIDTHAVAAAYLLPLAATSRFVKQAWGELGGATSRATGMNGFYPFIAEAYRRVGAQRGLLARQVQSITWEQGRALFTPARKRNVRLLQEADVIWARYRAGDIEAAEARTLMVEALGGFQPLVWDGTEVTEAVTETYQGRARTELVAREAAKAAAPRILVEAKPNTNPELLARWNELNDEQRASATSEILSRVVQLVATEFGVGADLQQVRGAWMGEPEAAMAVTLDRPESSVAVAGALGDLLHQEAMFVISPTQAQGLGTGKGILITLPDGYTVEQIDEVYDVLWAIKVNGRQPFVGHSTQGRHMVIGVDEAEFGVTAAELADLAFERLGDTFSIQTQDVFTRFLNRGQDYARAETTAQPPAAGRPPVETRSDRLVGQTTAIYREALDRVQEREPTLAQGEPGRLEARRGEFFPQQLTAVLHEGADFSTVVHEMSHYFFEVTERLLAQPDPPQLLLDDFHVFLEWTGVESFGAWQAMSFEQRRPHTEAFAFAFEVYLFEGRAPSTKMARLFDKIRRFMVRVYQDVVNVLNPLYREQHGRDLPALTPEMRGVFDRMLAAEQDVARADAVRSFVPLFESQEASGLSDQQWADYIASLDEAREAAVTDVTQASLKQMQWLSRARGKVLQKLQRQHNKLRREVAAEVEQEVRARPVYRAIRYLRHGEIDLGADGGVATVTGVYQMNTARVRELLPPGAALTDMAGMTTQAGLDPDVVAELFGFESGRALVEALVEAAPLDQEVATQTDVRMLQEHGDLVDEAQIEQAVQEALHNEARARFVAVELNFLQRAQRPVSVMTAAAKQAARRILARKKMRDVRPSDFAAAEVRARRSAETAVKKGDPQAAITAKHQELLQHHLAKEALRVRRDSEKTQRFFRKFNRPDKKLATTRNVDYIGVGRAILAQHGLGPAATAAKPHLDLIEQYAPELLEDLRPLIEVGLNDTTHWRDMTLGDFEVLEDILRSLWFQSRRDRVIDIDGQKVERDSIIEGELLPALRAPEAKRRGRTLTPKERQRVDFGALLAWFRHVEAWAVARDGGTPGAIHRYLFSLLREPVNAYETEKLELARELHQRLNKHDFGDRRATIYSEELDFTFRNKAELIGALRHAGTESNLRRLLLGHQMVEQPEEPGGPIDTSRWWQFIDNAITNGVLTQADFDLVQHIWDVYDTLLPRSQKAHFDVYGYRFEEVPKVPIRTPWGTYRGGYVPLKYDPHDSPEFFKDDPLLASSEEYRRSFPSTGRGFTFSRVTEFVAPLLLDVRMDAHTLDEHLRFIHLQRPGRDVLRLLRDPRVADALKRVDKNLVEEMFIPWVGSVLKNRIATPGGPRQLSQFLTVLRRRSGLATMFGNLTVGVQQLTGLGNSLLYVKLGYLRGAAALYARELFTGRLVADVKARSEFMTLRLGKGIGQIRDDIDVMLKPGWVGRAEQWSLEHGYFLQRWFQQPVDVITWKGRYDQSIAEGRTETQSVRDADAAVRRSQASGQAADLSRLEKGHPLVRLMMQFSSFWIATANAVLQRPTARERVAAGAIAVMSAGLVAGAVTQALRGGWEDEDDDGVLWDDVTSWAFGETLQATAGIVAPSLGPNLLNPITGEFGGRITLGAGFGSLERGLAAPIRTLLNATDDKREVSGRDVKDLGMLLSLILGIPVTPVTDRLKFLLDEEERAEAIRGAVVGR